MDLTQMCVHARRYVTAVVAESELMLDILPVISSCVIQQSAQYTYTLK